MLLNKYMPSRRSSRSSTRRRNRRGGNLISTAANALLPFGFLALHQFVKNRQKSGGSRRQRSRR